MRVFTVPSGSPVISAISEWVSPSKKAISSVLRCSAGRRTTALRARSISRERSASSARLHAEARFISSTCSVGRLRRKESMERLRATTDSQPPKLPRVATKLFRERIGPCATIVAAGGVAANDAIRRAMARYCGEAGVKLVIPPPKLCTDNGAMIAWAGIERLGQNLLDDMTFAARPRWPLDANAEAAHHGKA